ncbi:MAG: VOC family protein [Alphaproteobacteria bacterium]|nr:VOC family protein [Alphaproteobacteria bacterium]
MNANEFDTVKPRIVRTHIALFVRDPVASAAWYKDVLGMEITATREDGVFLSFGQKHHDIALLQADPTPEGANPRGQVNLQHYGLEIEGGIDELRRLYGALLKRNVPIVKTTDHKIGFGVYFTDPDGHRLEFFCDTTLDDDEGKKVLGDHNAPSNPFKLDPL